MESSVRRSTHPGVEVLTVAGDLDLCGAISVREELVVVLRDSTHPAVVVDLTDVRLVDCTGLGVLVAAHKRLQLHGDPLRLVVGHDGVRRVLRVSSLARVFGVFGDLPSALSSVGTDGRPAAAPV